MENLNMQELLEAGMHFGHLTRRWNPKMKPYIYGVRNGVHIIDLSKTVPLFESALQFVTEVGANGGDVLFVGTKKQAQDIIQDEANRCHMFYVNNRWLGGTLTNFRTIKASIDRLKDLQKKKEDGTFAVLNKKEKLMIDREIERLLRSLGGIQNMVKTPAVMVIVDPGLEHIALHEATVLGIPLVALADTNCDPDEIDYLIPGNDDALRSIRIFLEKMSNQVLEGLNLRETRIRKGTEASATEEKPAIRESAGEKAHAYVSKETKSREEAPEEGGEGSYSVKVTEEPEKAAEPEESNEETGEKANA